MAEEITYRLATDADIDSINDFYNGFYKKNRTHGQFVWEFNSAPAGKAIYVIAISDSKVIGTQCAIPYYIITNDNKEILTAKSEDTLVSPDYRGKNIFDNMYGLLIEECKKAGISFIWGFTYAERPFKKLGFEIPFRSAMGILCIRPFMATRHFYSITAKKNIASYLKILLLCGFSALKYRLFLLRGSKLLPTDNLDVDLNTSDLNYLKNKETFGLKLDKDFLDYRTRKNAYSSDYRTINYRESGRILISIKYIIAKKNIGFILHLYIAPGVTPHKSHTFIKQVLKETELKKCVVIRFWGFEHNAQNQEEIIVLKKSHFTFLKRGISFVGLKLGQRNDIDFCHFVLSRMASQGTD